jgi:MarR family 2-MHQ and catechol resistance regulon transcriptional repressor
MGTKYTGSKKEIQALESYIKLVRSGESLSSKIYLVLKELELSESQFGVLDALFHLGPMKQREIGQKILKSGGNITMVIDNLEKRNFVKRKRGEKDRRQFVVHLTKKGRKKFAVVLPKVVNLIIQHFEILNADEQNALQRLCKIIGLQVRN